MGTAYATLAHVYACLSAQAFIVRPRAIEAVDTIGGVFTLTAHGLVAGAGDVVRFRLLGPGGATPGNVATGVSYYAAPIDFYDFRVSATPGGTPIIPSTTGSGSWGMTVDPQPRLLFHLADTAAQINNCLTAHAPPVVGADILIGLNARMTARAGATSLQVTGEAFRGQLDALTAALPRDEKTLADWLEGKPILPGPTDQDTVANVAPRAMGRRPVLRGRRCSV